MSTSKATHRFRGAPSTTSDDLVALVVHPPAQGLPRVANGPTLSDASGELLRAVEITDEHGDRHSIQVPVERPLTIVVDDQEIATLWTLGAGAEWLVLGYLRNRRQVSDVTLVESITVDWQSGTAAVRTRSGYYFAANRGTSSAPIDIRTVCVPAARISRTTLLSMLESMHGHDAVWRAAGSVQGCALFAGSDLWLSVEDVSRRNSVDIISGWMMLHGISGADKVLLSTGRLTAEVVMKAAVNGIPIVVSRKGVTGMCCDLADKLGMTLFGHAGQNRYVCYAGAERFDAGS